MGSEANAEAFPFTFYTFLISSCSATATVFRVQRIQLIQYWGQIKTLDTLLESCLIPGDLIDINISFRVTQ